MSTKMEIGKRLAFIVHPDKKTDLIEWSYFNKELLMQHEIIATGEAANILEGTLNKPVCKFLTGPNEGYQELGNLITEGRVDAIIFMRSAAETPQQKNGIRSIMHSALEADIIIASNKVSADFILTSPLMNEEKKTTAGNYPFQLEQGEKNTAA